MTIRCAQTTDVAAVLDIWNDAIRHSTATFTDQEKSADDITHRLERMWVAGQGRQVVGFATYGPFRDGPGYAFVSEVSIYLTKAAQGRGHGRGLMEALQDHAARHGKTQLIAAIGGENPGAEAFHAKLGFRKVAQMSDIGWKFGRWHDLILMQKKIETPH